MSQFPMFLVRRDELWHRMGFRAIVSRKTCEEVYHTSDDMCMSPLPYRVTATTSSVSCLCVIGFQYGQRGDCPSTATC